ncbi:hypothetical protein EU99_1805 [Prochlorococcus marinus str. MIT 9321]|uniref:GP-PDE domain-containing protein n=1 Tax=Prochlorococcus marinus str. MIT 9401 TaxID=167551 RepID=A0A0A2BCM4_PROMR|nr:hypothetical protein [Prochlorococcus marinus]KGG02843.1 hypothetical protein EU99_1805 [Prochlorococcus marinus str. MIT 9321]KGG05466.1 hypothetical protein EV00_1100 [Prochlorococcus marinus str. MIT 9322]KGG10500.1 hypothetical protein EV01_0128 [Prochlorococcus marinus str. MIT 9401]
MELIAHRINTVKLLKQIPLSCGVEIDIRTENNNFILAHDPFQKGENLIKWLEYFEHKILILNVKEEGLEKDLLKIMKKFSIKDFFFLDQSFPFLVKTSFSGESRTAIRFSEFESIENAYKLARKIDWVWVDFFNKFPLEFTQFKILKKYGYKICIVSPELQGKSFEIVKDLKDYLKINRIKPDAICTKLLDFWS